MARLVARHAGRGVVLLAGNGHVRSDIGVPRWLPADLRPRTRVVGALEAGSTEPAAYDTVLRTAAQTRPDPCAGCACRPRPRRLPLNRHHAQGPADHPAHPA